MSTSILETETALAKSARVTARALVVDLRDVRTVSVPLEWYPRLVHGSSRERQRWELIGPGVGIHWPALDEDISIEGLLEGPRSGESEASFQRWLNRGADRLTAACSRRRRIGGGRRRAPRQRLRG